MGDPGSGGREPDYAIDPADMEKGITEYLDPVIEQLRAVSTGHTEAAAELEQGHSGAAGWVGGGSDMADIRVASSSFFNSIVWRAEDLAAETTEITRSLEEYREVLRAHKQLAVENDNLVADRFNQILADLEERSSRWAL
jgi:hypothetical protein